MQKVRINEGATSIDSRKWGCRGRRQSCWSKIATASAPKLTFTGIAYLCLIMILALI